MLSKQLTTHIGCDGILNLQVPLNIKDLDVEIMLIVQPFDSSSKPKQWSHNFLEKFVGSMPDFPEIEYEGDFEKKEGL